MTAIETLISVLCGQDGKCCISGSDDDRHLIDSALAELAQLAQPAAEASRFGSPELQAMIIARCVEKDQADNKKKDPL